VTSFQSHQPRRGPHRRTSPIALLVWFGVTFVCTSPGLAVASSVRPTSDQGTGAPPTLGAVKQYLDNGRPADAEKAARELLRTVEEASDPDSLAVADVLDQLAVALRRGGKAAKPGSRELCERAVRIRARHPGADSLDYALSLQNLGALLLTAGNYGEAERPLERSAEIRERALGSDHLDVATSLTWLATLRARMGEPADAEPLLRRALEIRTQELGPRDPAVIQCMDALAGVLMELGDFTESEVLFEKELKLLGKDSHGNRDVACHNLAVLLEVRGDYDRALVRLNESLRIRTASLGWNHPLVATDLRERAYILQKLGDVKGARRDYERALKIDEAVFGQDNPETASSHMGLGLFYLDQGDTARAKQQLQAAMRVQARGPGEEDYEFAWTLNGLAEIAMKEGDDSLALRYCRHGLNIRENTLGPTHPQVALSLGTCAAIYSRAGEPDSAFQMALRAAKTSREHLRLTARALSEREALAYSAATPPGLGTAIALASIPPSSLQPETVREAWDSVIRSRTLVLDEIVARQHVASVQESDTTLASRMKELEEARQRLSNLLVRGPEGGAAGIYQSRLQRARDDLDRAEQAVASASRAYREDQARTRTGYTETAAALAPTDALVAYVSYTDPDRVKHYAAFFVAGGGVPVAIYLGFGKKIDALVSRWSARVAESGAAGQGGSQAEARCRAAGDALRKAIWDPVGSRLAGAKRVFIVPDGLLYRVSFAGLPVGTSQYLVETAPVLHYLTSERDLIGVGVDRTEGSGLLALGGPTFGGGAGSRAAGLRSSRGASPGSNAPQTDCPDFRTIEFTPLPETTLEAKEVVALWNGPGKAILLTGSGATEAAFKRDAPGRRVLHLATHGFFLASICSGRQGARGIGGLSTGEPKQPARPKRQQVTPLRLSGFALANANSRNQATPEQDDGILTAGEVASLNLATVDLAVLSGCDTGLGEIQVGEGVLGLRRAFQVAGVKTTVMSLWEVEDLSTREWMKRFYEARFQRHDRVADCIRAASLGMLGERRAAGLSTSPFYWAAFVAAGDWN
jgi:CHAT domain-containing protein/tetratricopeptide (TPR) repeat protein